MSFAQAALGAQIDVPTLDGKVKMKIPAGTQSGKVFRIKGKGIPHLHGGGRGDQHVRVLVGDSHRAERRAAARAAREVRRGLGSRRIPQAQDLLREGARAVRLGHGGRGRGPEHEVLGRYGRRGQGGRCRLVGRPRKSPARRCAAAHVHRRRRWRGRWSGHAAVGEALRLSGARGCTAGRAGAADQRSGSDHQHAKESSQVHPIPRRAQKSGVHREDTGGCRRCEWARRRRGSRLLSSFAAPFEIQVRTRLRWSVPGWCPLYRPSP